MICNLKSMDKSQVEKILAKQNIYSSILTPFVTVKQYNGMDRLYMAVLYLQVDRVEELLKIPEILKGINTKFDYGLTVTMLCCLRKMPSGIKYYDKDNNKKYKNILCNLLSTGLVDLSIKSDKGYTVSDYIKHYKLYEIEYILNIYKSELRADIKKVLIETIKKYY